MDKEFKANLDREATQNFFFDKLEEENKSKKPRASKRSIVPEEVVKGGENDLEQ